VTAAARDARVPAAGVVVSGGASAEELAAVLAALRAAAAVVPLAPEPSGYERWRRGRLAAMRRGSVGRML
jgi:hypothetical protein